MEQPRSSWGKLLSRSVLTAAMLAAVSAAPIKAAADETEEKVHQVIAIVETGLELGSDTQIDTVVCEAKGPEISCTVHENSDERRPDWQDLHGHWLVKTFAEAIGKNGETLAGKLVVEDRYGNIVWETFDITGGVFFSETEVPFDESHLVLYQYDTDLILILKPIEQNGTVEYAIEESFPMKDLVGEGWIGTMSQEKLLGVSQLIEDKGKKYVVVIEKKEGQWQITEKYKFPEGESDPWEVTVLENYPGGPKIALADANLGLLIYEPGNLQGPIQTFQYPQDEGIFNVKLHPNGKLLIASGLNSGFFIIDVEDPSNYTYIFGAAGNYGFDELGLGQNFLSYVEILDLKPLKVKITKYKPNTFDFIWNGSDEENLIPFIQTMAGIEYDEDKDLVTDFLDNCFQHKNPGQEDSDGDGIGDSCEVVEPEEPAEPEPIPEQGPEPEEAGEPEPEEPPESQSAEEIAGSEGESEVSEPPPDATEPPPEVSEPPPEPSELEPEAAEEVPEVMESPKEVTSTDTGTDEKTDGSTDEEETPSSDGFRGDDAGSLLDAGTEEKTDPSVAQSPSGARGKDGCFMGTNNKGNPWVLWIMPTAGAGLALRQKRRRSMDIREQGTNTS